jgi:hypothetical protein
MSDMPDPKTALLESLGTVVIPANPKPLAIRGYLTDNPKVKIASVLSEFKSRFFDLVQQATAEATYRKYRLLRISADGPIIAELGGETKAEGTLAAAFALLDRQGTGAAGFLQTNGYANIFYVKDKKGVLCAVRIGWADGGWVFDAIPVQDPLAWNGKHQIFCPV